MVDVVEVDVVEVVEVVVDVVDEVVDVVVVEGGNNVFRLKTAVMDVVMGASSTACLMALMSPIIAAFSSIAVFIASFKTIGVTDVSWDDHEGRLVDNVW